MIGAVAPRDRQTVKVTDDGTGRLSYTERFTTTLVWTSAIRQFPFDRHTIPVRVVPDANQLFVQDPQLLPAHDSAALRLPPDWKWGITPDELRPVTQGELTYDVHITRRFRGYAINVVLPMVLIVLIAGTVFWISPRTSRNERTAISVTMVLALVAFDFFSNGAVPSVPHLTLLDMAVLVSYVAVTLALFANIRVHKLFRENAATAEAAIDRSDRWMRRAFPAAYLGALAVVAGLWRYVF